MDRENHVIKRDNTKGNEEFCGKVPLHQTNLIQPHGVLLVVKTDDFSILQCSENVSRFLGQDAAKVVTTNLADYFLSEELAILKKRLSLPLSGKIPVTLHVQQVSFLALLQQYEGYFILEVEKIEMEDGQHSFVEIYQELKLVTTAIEEADTLQEATAVAARELKRISGFDKVMIYQFDPDWNGEVIAEEMEEGMDTYLGLKFPASDIPKQARDLYKRCPYRLIPTVDYTPVRLYPVINPLTQTFTNLTDSNFRSVAAVHLEYLKNMKVAASMSTRILVEGELWGLIACHHRQPNYLSYQLCSVFEMLSGAITAKINEVHSKEAYTKKTVGYRQISQVLEKIYKHSGILKGLRHEPEELLALLNADGAAVIINKQIETFGQVPEKNEIENLLFWLHSHEVNTLYHQPSLTKVYENEGWDSEKVSGLLALPIQPSSYSFILGFRGESVQKVNWSGNPNETIHFEPDKKNYHPRNSFSLWQETVRGTAIPWKKEELEIAESLRSVLINYTLNQ